MAEPEFKLFDYEQYLKRYGQQLLKDGMPSDRVDWILELCRQANDKMEKEKTNA